MKKQRQPPLIQIDRTNLPIALSTLAQIADRDNPGIQSTIAKFRDSDAHLLLTILPTTRDRSLALMAYELNGTIHCQFAGEPYPDGFTPQDARIHANVIAEQASQHIESPDERLTPAAQSALETAQHIIQLTNAGLLHTPLELVPDLLHSLESAGADRHTIHTVIRLIAGGQTELHFAIAETAQRPALLTSRQAAAIRTALLRTRAPAQIINSPIMQGDDSATALPPAQPFNPVTLRKFMTALRAARVPATQARRAYRYLQNIPPEFS